MRYLIPLLTAGALLLGCEEAPVDEGEILLADDFDDENDAQGARDFDGFTHWDVTRGSVDLRGNGLDDVLPGDGLYVDLDGGEEDAGTLISKRVFELVPGRYRLELDVAGPSAGEPDGVLVSVRDVLLERIELEAGEAPTTIRFSFDVETTTVADVEVSGSGDDDDGVLLLGVMLERRPDR